jgi:hypothetical protein
MTSATAAVAASADLVVAAAFLSTPLLRHRFGASTAKTHAEAELVRQGIRPEILGENGLKFDASGHETAIPGSVAVIMLALSAVTIAGPSWTQPLTWVLAALVALGNGLVLWSQLTAAQSVTKAFARKNDPELSRVDVPALLKAAESGFPTWAPTLVRIRHTAVFAGAFTSFTAALLGF